MDDLPFKLNTAADPKKTSSRRARRGQTRFLFDVFDRYGAACVACGLEVEELFEAAHLKTRAKKGTHDPRNGLPLCRNHRRALDAGLLGIDPGTLELAFCHDGPMATDLGVVKTSLADLDRRPHSSALQWAWSKLFGDR